MIDIKDSIYVRELIIYELIPLLDHLCRPLRHAGPLAVLTL